MTLGEFAARLKGAVGLGRSDRDLDEELAFHREQLERRHRAAGLDAAEARRRAALALGGAAQIGDAWRDQRGLPLVDALAQDTRYALRIFRHTPGFTLAALLTLALGIGANTAIFSVVDAVVLRPLPYVDPDRLVTVGDRDPDGSSSNVGFATVVDWRARARTFESFAVMTLWRPTLLTGTDAERLEGARVSWNYFDVLGARPLIGRTFVPGDDRPEDWFSVVLSESLWRRRFGADPGVIGRTVMFNDRPHRVLGVMPASFQPLDAEQYYRARPEVWAALGYSATNSAAAGTCRSCQHLHAVGRLRPGVTLRVATAEMNTIRAELRRAHPADYESGSIAIVPLADALTGGARGALFVLLGAVASVLLIACANVASLQLARGQTRQREMVLRSALGAGRARVLRQLLTESLLLAFGGAAAGIVLAEVAVRVLVAFAPVSLPRLDQVAVDGRVLAFTAIATLAAGMIFGLVPALKGAAAGGEQTLVVDLRGTVAGRSRARTLLIVGDFALALVLLAGAGVMLRTVAAIAHANPGFRADGVATLQFSLNGTYPTDDAAVAVQRIILDKLRAIPGVGAVALAGLIPFEGGKDCWGFHARGRLQPNPANDPCVDRYSFTGDYLRTMGIPLLAGRTFTEFDDASAARVILISQATAKLIWGDADPLGAQVRIGSATEGRWRTVVGIVGDVHHDDLTVPPAPAMYTPEAQITSVYLTAVIGARDGDAAALVPSARAAIHEVNPRVPIYGVAPLTALVDRSAAERRFVMRLVVAFAAIALVLAAVGLYGVVSYAVSERAREVGVRLALGARTVDVVRLVLGGGLVIAGVGVVGGLTIAMLATRWLGSLVFGVSPTDALTLTLAAALLLLVALLAHAVPLRRALRIDPASALRAE